MTNRTPPEIFRLKRDQALVVFFDNQTGLVASAETSHPDLLKKNMLALRDTALAYDLPAILTASDPGNPQGPGPVLPELTERFPDSPVIDRTSVGGWEDKAFRARVEATGRRQLVLSGIATDAGVAFTALEARRDGYEVFLVVDASATWSERAEMAAILRMTAAGVVPMSWIAVAAELQHDWSLPGSEALARLLQGNISRWSAVAAGNAAASR